MSNLTSVIWHRVQIDLGRCVLLYTIFISVILFCVCIHVNIASKRISVTRRHLWSESHYVKTHILKSRMSILTPSVALGLITRNWLPCLVFIHLSITRKRLYVLAHILHFFPQTLEKANYMCIYIENHIILHQRVVWRRSFLRTEEHRSVFLFYSDREKSYPPA